METKYLTSLLMFLLVQVFINGVIAQKPEPQNQSYKCNNIGDLKSDDLLKAQDTAFSNLIRNMGRIEYPYNGYAYGNAYGMYSIGLCPPNIKRNSCLECLNNTTPYLKRNCYKRKEGVAWTVLSQVMCIVRYADTGIYNSLGDWAWMTFSSPPNESFGDAVVLRNAVNDLANKLKDRTAGFSEDVKFAFGSNEAINNRSPHYISNLNKGLQFWVMEQSTMALIQAIIMLTWSGDSHGREEGVMVRGSSRSRHRVFCDDDDDDNDNGPRANFWILI
ncbi:hypothetical protein QVD17_10136 [Tagetes erecta]|uniref:Gnk2-homologous domain-containing protein n=1 Tax=Tagetes erecta TaxID=13708 RepID=A0AAD8L7B3_TARER|nr:hypothetical protein QVD17_10136 [Tagetes erecta]